MPWWNAQYANRVPLTIQSTADGYALGSVARFVTETQALIAAGDMRPDRRDLRVVYDTGTPVEIDRVLTDTGTICFRLQATIPSQTTCEDYFLYYGNAAEAGAPMADERAVWPLVVDGDDLASLTVTGTVTIASVPRPRILKLHSGPIVSPAPGGLDDRGCRDAYGLFYESGAWYCYYAAQGPPYSLVWQNCLARSTDLVTWEKLGVILPPGTLGTSDGGSTDNMAVYKIGGTYYAVYLGSPQSLAVAPGTNINDNMGWCAPPYVAHGATAESPLGPWTRAGIIIPLTFDSFEPEYGGSVTAGATINSFDGGATYRCYFSNGTPGVGMATAAAPLGPYTYAGDTPLADVENPVVYPDPGSGSTLMHINRTGGGSSPLVVLYWGSDPATWSDAACTTLIGPSIGSWDAGFVGMGSVPVIKDGMIYLAYDGGAAYSLMHFHRSVGLAQAEWPYPWGNVLNVASGATLLGSPVAGNFRLRVRAKLKLRGASYSAVGLKGATHTYLCGLPTSGTAVVVDGSVNNTSFPVTFNPGDAWEYVFERTGSTLKVYCGAVLLWQGACSTESLGLYAANDAVVEEARFEPASFAVAVDAATTTSTTSTTTTSTTTTSTTTSTSTSTTTPAPTTTSTTTTPAPTTTTPAPTTTTTTTTTAPPGSTVISIQGVYVSPTANGAMRVATDTRGVQCLWCGDVSDATAIRVATTAGLKGVS